MVRKVEISYKTIIFTVFFLAFLWFVYLIRDIVLQFFVATLLMSVLNPLIKRLSKMKIPKTISIILTYVAIISILGVSIGIIVPPLIEQTTNLANNLPYYIKLSGVEQYANGDLMREAVSQLGSVPGQIIKAGLSLFTNLISIIAVLIFSFYLLVTRDRLGESLIKMFGNVRGVRLNVLIDKLETRLGRWARGQFLLMLTIALFSYFGFLILGVPYALPLALLSGLLELVPMIGPIVAAVPAAILAFSVSPLVGFLVCLYLILLQQLENYLLVPKIMQKSTGSSPIVILLAIAIGARVAGVVGVIIAIPVVIILQVLLEEHFLQSS